MNINRDNIIAFIIGEIFVFSEKLMTEAIDFSILSFKTLFIAILGGVGGMFGKWLWNKLINGKI